ncbi:hypothetical protein [Piscirickettsia litoralis]|uniref:Lipoprotein n=1 Tax=Piscirickettsia litoralis TaxID=1891921 RepID=A0ABX3A1W3_9GAMM|nr:hypothetical protein [Piscirickettsia litoralis]ODN41390.1 hypothetical protein BGC07_16615 [Piscirickettsia litoralis]
MFKKAVTIAALAASYALLNGCASMQSAAKYDSDHSRAYNLSTAAGLEQGIRDYDKPKTGTGSLANSGEYGAAFTATGFYIPYSGLSGLASGGLNLISWLVQPEDQYKHNNFFAWMPKGMATSEEDSLLKMKKIIRAALKKTFKDMGVDYHKRYEDEDVYEYYIYSKKYNCPTMEHQLLKNMCIVGVRVYEPYIQKAPLFLKTSNKGKKSYKYSVARNNSYNNIGFKRGDMGKISEVEFFEALSKNLPKWAFMYIAPNQFHLPSGKVVKAPYLLEHGKPLFYVI